MSSRPTQLGIAKALVAALMLAALTATFYPPPAFAQEELSRKAKVKVAPVYPEIAKRMNITGSVKVIVVLAPNGTIKSTKVVGGHPLLVTAALDALKKWKFEAAPEEDTGIVEFKFMPQDQ